MRLMEDCNYRLKWQIEDMQHALDDANAHIQTLTKETGTLRDRGSSTGPDLTLPPALHLPMGPAATAKRPTLPPAPGSLDVQPGREFRPELPGTLVVPAAKFRCVHVDRLAARSRCFADEFHSAAGRKPRPRIDSIQMSTLNELF